MAKGKNNAKGKNGEKKERAPRTAGASFKDVQLAYLTQGIEGVEGLWDAGKVKKATIRRAFKKLAENEYEAGDFAKWIVEKFGALSRGRTAPKPGETRSYKAQGFRQRTKLKDENGNDVLGKDGKPEYKISETESIFFRCPLESLGATKGTPLYVAFGEDTIVISTSAFSDEEVEEEEEEGEDFVHEEGVELEGDAAAA
jgi:hypothetical protein